MQKKLEFIDLFNDLLDEKDFYNLCFSDDEIKAYHDGSFDPFIIFEGDPDYMIEENGNTVYFIIIDDKVYYIDLEGSDENLDKLREFCLGQNTKISLGGYNTRSCTDHWDYLEDNNWDGWEKCKNLKIAYRGGCGYCYTLFEYVE